MAWEDEEEEEDEAEELRALPVEADADEAPDCDSVRRRLSHCCAQLV